MGKVTIVVESDNVSTRTLETLVKGYISEEILKDDEDLEDIVDPDIKVYVVPSDDEPYDGPDYPPGTNAGSP